MSPHDWQGEPGVAPPAPGPGEAGLSSFARRVGVSLARAPFDKRTWARTTYALVSLPLAAVSFVVVVGWTVLSVGLAFTFVGLPLLALGGVAARRLGAVHRRLAAGLLGEHVDPPRALAPGPGFFGWLQVALRDRAAWRARLYLVVKLPMAVLMVAATTYAWWVAVTCVTAPLWWQSPVSGRHVFDLPARAGPAARLGVVAFGVVVLAAAPWIVLAVTWLDGQLIHALLGRGRGPDRVRDLELARSQVAEESAATLRRIERDLHDGTQAQLTTVAMNLGQVKEKLEHGRPVAFDPDGALDLVGVAHRQVKEALVDLRAIARSIHPPALDVGLDAALSTLVSRSAVPATLHVDVPVRPTQAIETITYYSVAELLANVAKHSQARRAEVEVVSGVASLLVRVIDDGVGGARVGAGTGLSGLADRVGAVDGHLSVASPPGGPTVVVVELPLHA